MLPAYLGDPVLVRSLRTVQPVRTAAAGSTGFRVQSQLQLNWCWSAVSTSISLFYTPASPWTQCSVADAELGRGDCCAGGASGPCNRPWYLDRALARVGCYVSIAGPCLMADLQSEIASGRVPCVRIGWSDGSGHFVAVAGWYTGAQGIDYVVVEDPNAGTVQLAFVSLLTAYRGSGRWTHSYMTSPPGGPRSIPPPLPDSRAERLALMGG